MRGFVRNQYEPSPSKFGRFRNSCNLLCAVFKCVETKDRSIFFQTCLNNKIKIKKFETCPKSSPQNDTRFNLFPNPQPPGTLALLQKGVWGSVRSCARVSERSVGSPVAFILVAFWIQIALILLSFFAHPFWLGF